MRPPARHPRNRDAAVRRKRKARHALSGKPVPNPLPRSAVVEEAPGHEGKWRARPSDSQGRDLTHEKSRRDPHLARAEPDEAVRTGRNITRIALVFEAGRDGFWLDLWRLILFRKIPEYPVSGTDGSNPPPSSGESVSQRELAWRGREAGLFARMCGPCQARESTETGMAGRHRTTGDECLCWAKFQYRGAGDGSKLIAASCR